MVNPFQYGGIVDDESFCNRTQELHDLRRAAENGDRLLVYAERRMGKTSLIKRLLKRLPKSSFIAIYVDLWATGGSESFASAIAKATPEAAETRADKLLETGKELFKHLIPSVTIDQAGNPSIEFGARQGLDTVPQIEDALDAPARLALKRKKQIVVVYDEIQRIAEYGEDTVERVMRSRIQQHQGVSYFFLGSRKHLIRQMFTQESRPLFQSAGHYPLSTIATAHWIPFIRDRFAGADKPLEDSLIEKLCARTEGHPYYTQHLAHDLWEIVLPGHAVLAEDLARAEDTLLQRLGHTYTVLLERTTENQRKLLRGMSSAVHEARPFTSEFLRKNHLAASSAHRAAEGLLSDDVIDRENGGFIISDRFFKIWLARL